MWNLSKKNCWNRGVYQIACNIQNKGWKNKCFGVLIQLWELWVLIEKCVSDLPTSIRGWCQKWKGKLENVELLLLTLFQVNAENWFPMEWNQECILQQQKVCNKADRQESSGEICSVDLVVLGMFRILSQFSFIPVTCVVHVEHPVGWTLRYPVTLDTLDRQHDMTACLQWGLLQIKPR